MVLRGWRIIMNWLTSGACGNNTSLPSIRIKRIMTKIWKLYIILILFNLLLFSGKILLTRPPLNFFLIDPLSSPKRSLLSQALKKKKLLFKQCSYSNSELALNGKTLRTTKARVSFVSSNQWVLLLWMRLGRNLFSQ